MRRANEGSNIDPKWKKAAAYKKENNDDSDDYDDGPVSFYHLFLSLRVVTMDHFTFKTLLFLKMNKIWNT